MEVRNLVEGFTKFIELYARFKSMLSEKKTVRDLMEILAQAGVKHVVISPGSRNAPLTFSFEGDGRFRCHSIVDERSAGYFALGIAQQTRNPVAVVCTSGTAAFNYGPAVAEAYYQRIPLVVLTADRPEEWVNQGDGQTIMQEGIFGGHVRFNATLRWNPGDKQITWHNRRLISEALDQCKGVVDGPVHLNIPLRDNLYAEFSGEEAPSDARWIRRARTSARMEKGELQEIIGALNNCKRILVIAGLCESNSDLQSQLERFGRQPSVTVLTETTSNLHSPDFIGCIDRLIMGFDETDVEHFKPDLLITLGNQIISKKIKALLRSYDGLQHWHVDKDQGFMDTYQHQTVAIRTEPASFFKQVNAQFDGEISDYHQRWIFRNNELRELHLEFDNEVPFSDLRVVSRVLRRIPPGSNVQMGNSSIVRYIQLFDPSPEFNYFGNRGTSGIDGCTSTASGAALAGQTPTILLTGDVAFFYDANALWNKQIPRWLKIVVVNNGGGGIFRIIDGPASTPVLEKHFETTHHLRARHLAEMHGLDYVYADNAADLDRGLEHLYRSDRCCILEVATPRLENDGVLKNYFKNLKDKTQRT
ncbi:MAG: 2-succinyl-5-enolpyruvyl-6-hydroxy-3-cyclohexene-1-carboxylic-acid synthase [Flavobacteriales bacterium]|nr:2-succinyl-5-enolpyruvyl-6-hydroxy-3-cyclohexene-1-carboxylic-acid synthase [Flavobacteriales bacterium]